MCLGEEDPIQSNPTKLDRPPARSLHDSEEGSEVGVGQQRRRRPPSLDSLQTWPPPPPPNSFPSLARTLQIRPLPYFYLLLPPDCSRRNPQAGRQIHHLPPWSKEAGIGCRPKGSAVNPPWQPSRNSFSTSSFSGHPQPEPGGHRQGRAGQGRADNRHQLLLQIIGRI